MIAKYLSGVNEPSFSALEKLHEYGLSIDWLCSSIF
jgi:hypothetical protein